MDINARYVHTNLVAENWKRLASFYQRVFGCQALLPERHLSGQWLEDATGVPEAEIHGIHLSLPGWGDNGPTLEVFQYSPQGERETKSANQPGFAHLAFEVNSVEDAVGAVLAAGGTAVGECVTVAIPGKGTITFAYVADPEGNIIELQN